MKEDIQHDPVAWYRIRSAKVRIITERGKAVNGISEKADDSGRVARNPSPQCWIFGGATETAN